MTKCKSCGADIIWIKTKNGKSMPCDLPSKPYIEGATGLDKIVKESGEVVNGMWIELSNVKPHGCGYKSHFATCPNADRHRAKQ